MARKLGTTTNPEYVRLANRLMGTLINYRRSATGAQFSEKESSQYELMFPNYRNNLPVNLALIDGLEREMRTYDSAFWKHKLGEGGAKLVLGDTSTDGGGAVSAAPTAAPANVKSALEGKPNNAPGKYYKMSDGSKWRKDENGITKVP
jgi:hypothetical protein